MSDPPPCPLFYCENDAPRRLGCSSVQTTISAAPSGIGEAAYQDSVRIPLEEGLAGQGYRTERHVGQDPGFRDARCHGEAAAVIESFEDAAIQQQAMELMPGKAIALATRLVSITARRRKPSAFAPLEPRRRRRRDPTAPPRAPRAGSSTAVLGTARRLDSSGGRGTQAPAAGEMRDSQRAPTRRPCRSRRRAPRRRHPRRSFQ